MNAFLLAVAVSFAVVFVAELGDKSQLMALTFATRYKPLPVLVGVTIATAIVHLLSVAVGHGLGAAIPQGWISLVAAVAFLGFGAWTLRGDTLTPEEEAKVRRDGRSAVVAASTAFFLAELGDKTMLATITLATQHGWFGVWIGSTVGMVLADGLAIWVGRALGRHVDDRVIRPGAALLFVVFGLWLADGAVGEITGASLLQRAEAVLGDRAGAWVATFLAVLSLAAVWVTRRRILGKGLWPRRSAGSGTARWWGRILFGAAALLGLLAPVAVALGLLEPISVFAAPGSVTVGAGLLLLGVSVLLVAQVQVGSARRAAAEGDGPLARGLFRRVRHPAFTGMVIATAGMMLMAPTALAVLGATLMIAAAQVHVRAVREPALLKVHGDRYVGYVNRTGRFLPRIR
jgi:putative Ca2+/H+ antiporter (TMEM165/GDT1 family)